MSKLYDLLSAMCGKIKKPDWNQNDPTAPDYVKNRPFYTGNPVDTVLVEESTVPFGEHSGIYVTDFPSTFSATGGETYKVSWDGTTYECTCTDADGTPVIGNLSIPGSGADTGEPFFMVVFNGSGIGIYTLDTSASHTISISGLVQEVVKIDEKYLPTIPAEKLPEIPAEKLPEIPAEKLPKIPVEKLPKIPVEIHVIEITGTIYSTIGDRLQPSYTVKNLSYAEMLEFFNSGFCLLKDEGNYYYSPVYVNVFNDSLNFNIVCYSNGADYKGFVFAGLSCSKNSTRFFRNTYYKISAEQG